MCTYFLSFIDLIPRVIKRIIILHALNYCIIVMHRKALNFIEKFSTKDNLVLHTFDFVI